MTAPEAEQSTAADPTAARTERHATLGIAFFIATTICFTLLDTTAKVLTDTMPVPQIVWIRFAGHMLLLLPLMIWLSDGRRALRAKRPGLQLLRSLLMVTITIFNFLGLQTLQLAEANAIFFSAPMFIAILAGPILGEWAGPRRWAAILIGFFGVIVITRPGAGNFGWPALYILAASLSYSLYTIATRKLARHDSTLTTLFYTPLVGVVLGAPFALGIWVPPASGMEWALLAGLGVFGGLGHILLVLALKHVPAPVLTPFMYIQLVWMALAGLMVFGDVPDFWTFVGAAIVIASGLYIWFREQRTGAPAKRR